jgi:hypothetical protein
LVFHFHQDGGKHDDCSLCWFQTHYYSLAQIDNDLITLLVGVAAFLLGTLSIRSLHYFHSSSRSPPA